MVGVDGVLLLLRPESDRHRTHNVVAEDPGTTVLVGVTARIFQTTRDDRARAIFEAFILAFLHPEPVC